MRLPVLVGLSLFVAACTPKGEDTAPADSDTPEGPECTSDGDCGDWEICEAEACIDGDRNNEIEEAETLLWESEEPGQINPEGDVDWYAVEAEGGEFVRISVVTAEEDGGLDSVVSVYTDSGKRLAWEDEHPAGDVSSADSMLFAYFPDAGVYYIKVEDRGTFYDEGYIGGPDEEYTLAITEWNTRVTEPDSAQDVGVDFATVATNTLYSFPVLIEEAGDSDWAALDLPDEGSPVTIIAMEHDEESDLAARVTLRNQDGDEVFSMLDPTSAAGGYFANPLGTNYVLGVTDENGAGGGTYWTWVFFVVREAGSGNAVETEPNDTIEAPEALTLDDQEPDSGTWFAAYRQGNIGIADDEDLFSFDVDFADAYITAYIGAQRYGSLLEARVEVLDATGTSVGVAEATPGSDGNLVDAGPFDPGTYYLRITPTEASAGEGGEGFYYLFGLHVTDFEVE